MIINPRPWNSTVLIHDRDTSPRSTVNIMIIFIHSFLLKNCIGIHVFLLITHIFIVSTNTNYILFNLKKSCIKQCYI